MKPWLFLFIWCMCTLSLEAASKHILLLHSYNKGIRWSDHLSQGVEDVLAPFKEYQLTTEYMDTKKNEDPEYLILLYNLFVAKLKYQQFDAVIAADDFAVKFVLNNKDKLFPNVPIFFCGIEKSMPGVDVERIKQEKIPLVFESKEVAINMQFLKHVMPQLKNVYIISDKTKDSMSINSIFQEEAQKLEAQGIHTTINLEGDLEKITDDLAHLPPHSAVMLGTLLRDNHGNYIPYYKVSDVINTSLAPVFAASDVLLSEGIIGGYLLRGYTNGVAVAKLTLAYLDGQKIDTSKPLVIPSEWIFDYKMLQKYNIDGSRLPKEATIINPPKSFFEEHRQLVEYAFIFFPFILISLILAIINIYQRQRMEKKLAAQSYLEQVLLNNIRSSIFWIDIKGYIKGCNDSFCTMVGLSLDQIVGRSICDVFTVLCHMPTKEQLFELQEIEFMRQERTYRLRSQIFLDEGGKNDGIVAVITDVTEKKQLEINTQFIIQQSKLAEIGEMLSSIVHQWKVPLVELSAVAHKMHHYDQKGKLTSKDIQNFYGVIMSQTIYMGETIDGFRDFIRPSNEPKAFDIDQGIKDVLTLLSYSMKYDSIEVKYTNHLTKSNTLWGYPNEFKQVIVNIINNAKDAILEAKAKALVSKGHIRIDLHEFDESVGVYIRDNGIGISQEILLNLFQPFFTTKTKGDGFGLYMAKLIIESKMNGKITLEPLTQGVKVCIELPRAKEKSYENLIA